MSFELEDSFGYGGAGSVTPQEPSLKKVLDHNGLGLDAALLNQADLTASSSSLASSTASGVAAGSDLTVTGIGTDDILLSVQILEDADGGSVSNVKTLDLDKAEITAADTVVLDEDTSGDLVFVTYISG